MTGKNSVRWNHNIHYHRRILDAVPAGARSALDVGTGNGLLAVDLRQRIPRVVGLDLDASMIASARANNDGVTRIEGDVMTYPFPLASFDVVTSVATLHHLPDLERSLRRLAELTSPGGVVACVGLARSSRRIDSLYDIAGLIQHLWYRQRHGVWEHSAPTVWPPPHTFTEVQRSVARVLPGARWSRLPMWRYAFVWAKPVS